MLAGMYGYTADGGVKTGTPIPKSNLAVFRQVKKQSCFWSRGVMYKTVGHKTVCGNRKKIIACLLLHAQLLRASIKRQNFTVKYHLCIPKHMHTKHYWFYKTINK